MGAARLDGWLACMVINPRRIAIGRVHSFVSLVFSSSSTSGVKKDERERERESMGNMTEVN